MTLTHILVFSLAALVSGWLIPRRWRIRFLLVASLVAIYWLQPSTPIRNLDFWLPSASIFLTVLVWTITRQPGIDQRRKSWLAGLILSAVVLAVGLTRYVDPICCLIPSRPPDLFQIILSVGSAIVLIAVISFASSKNHFLSYVAIVVILGLFVILKTEPLSRLVSAWLRSTTDQPVDLTSALDIPWLGFSYLAFRLLHVLRDYQSGKLPAFSLNEFVTYALFFPTITAGPIDRSQHFMGELNKSSEAGEEINPIDARARNTMDGARRLVLGSFKKFFLADSLALIALNPQNAVQTTSTFWTWVLLVAYGLRIYFDFSGYTDIAIGLGRLMGIRLPENFDRPYLKQNITAFWNSWHITLAQWFRAYYFNPLTRTMRTRMPTLPTWTIILIGQITTMALIGLWHGVTWNFMLWGAWHGMGLFIHNRWSDWIRPRIRLQETNQSLLMLSSTFSWMLTFLFVTLGWVWFTLPNPRIAWNVFTRLFGI